MTALAAVTDWTRAFRQAGLRVPPIPGLLGQSLQSAGEPHCFGTPGWAPNGTLEAAARAWLRAPRQDQAWVGFVGHGLRSTAVRLCLGTPEAAFFVQRQWTQAYGEGAACARAINGAFGLLEKILEALEQARVSAALPSARRLVIIDDCFANQRWGWVPDGAVELDDLVADPFTYIEVLGALQRLVGRPNAASAPGVAR